MHPKTANLGNLTEESARHSVTDDIVLTHMLRLKTLAAHYRLWDKEKLERKRSVKNLENAFFGFLEILKPDTFIEAGAHNALISVRAKTMLPQMSAYAFEANPFNYKAFKEQPALKEHDIIYVETALSDAIGDITFNVRTSFDGENLSQINPRSSILKELDGRVGLQPVTVKATTLDTYFSGRMPKSSALWIDVEGANREVLRGSAALLDTASIIMIEVEDDRRWDGQWVAFEVVRHLMNAGLIPVICDFQSRKQYNIIFLSTASYLNPDIGVSLDYFHSVRLHQK